LDELTDLNAGKPSPTFQISEAEQVLAYLQRTADFLNRWERLYAEISEPGYSERVLTALAQAEQIRLSMEVG